MFLIIAADESRSSAEAQTNTSSEEDGALRFGTTPRLYGKRTSTAWPPPTSTRTQHLRETEVSRRRGRTVILRRDSTTAVRRPLRSKKSERLREAVIATLA